MKAATEKGIMIGFGLSLFILAGIGVLSFRSTMLLIGSAQWVEQTQEIIGTLESLMSLTTEAETGSRGYIVTGKEDYLQPYYAAVTIFPHQYAHLKVLIFRNKVQLERAAVLDSLIRRRLFIMQSIVQARRDSGFAVSQRLVSTDLGQAVTDSIHVTMLKMRNEEYAFLSARSSERDEHARNALIIIVISSIVGFLIVSIASTTLSQHNKARKEAEEQMLKAKEMAEGATRAKSDFLAMMSHEIRTPMNGVIGMTDLLRGSSLTAQQRECVETIRVSGDTLLTIINDILDFSKIESRKIELVSQPVDLRRCIEEVFDLLGPKAVEKKIDLLSMVPPAVPSLVQTDANRLRQILFNLVNNALKFTLEGEVVISVDSVHLKEHELELGFSVTDTGIGIPGEKVGSLFQPFVQIDSSKTRRYSGTGLGLAISSKLVELMGGRIWVESEEGLGSTFFFTIRSAAVEDLPLTQAPYLAGDAPHLIGKRALLVDDSAASLRMLELYCSHWGMKTELAVSREEARRVLEGGGSFDLAVVDMDMPGTDGVSVAADLQKAIAPRELPVIILGSSNEERKLASAGGVVAAVILKPVKQGKLFAAISHVLSPDGSPAPHDEPLAPVADVIAGQFPLRVLLAEDNPVNQIVAVRMLEALGYEADVAANGREVVDRCTEKPYDVILMDVEMPEMDGIEATRRIQDLLPPHQRPRVIAMTAYAMVGDRERFLEAGMDDYLSKPLRLEELRAILVRWGLVTIASRTVQAPDEGRVIIDMSMIESIRRMQKSDKPSLLTELIDLYRKHSAGVMAKVFEAYKQGDEKGFVQAVHTLKGSSANIGAAEVARLCRMTEEKHREKDTVAVEELLKRLPGILETVWKELDKLR